MKKLIFSLFAVAISGVSMIAQEAKDSQAANVVDSSEKTQLPEGAEMLQVAGQLVKYGYGQEEALPLIQAVEIYKSVGLGALETEKAEEAAESGDASADAAKTSNVSFDIDQLLADAASYANGDEHYLALIENLKNSATRGATSNYAVKHTCVRANATDSYRVRFYGGALAMVLVSGDGDTDLDVYVYDENGNLVDSDTDYTDDCVCTWNPRWTGYFTIKVVNRGRVANCYSMAVN